MLEVNEFAEKHHDWIDSMNWNNKTILENLAFIGSEVGEATNECLGHKWTDEFPNELADIILRVLNVMVEEGIDPEEVLKNRMERNLNMEKDPNKIV